MARTELAAARYCAVVKMRRKGFSTTMIAQNLGCSKDLVRHYHRMAHFLGDAIPDDPKAYLAGNFKSRPVASPTEGNAKWQALR